MKSALGKNLGTLLNTGARHGGVKPFVNPALLRGNGANAGASAQPASVNGSKPAVGKSTQPTIPLWYFFAADVLLLQLALLLFWRNSGAMNWKQVVVPVGLVAMGCWMTVQGFKLTWSAELRPGKDAVRPS